MGWRTRALDAIKEAEVELISVRNLLNTAKVTGEDIDVADAMKILLNAQSHTNDALAELTDIIPTG